MSDNNNHHHHQQERNGIINQIIRPFRARELQDAVKSLFVSLVELFHLTSTTSDAIVAHLTMIYTANSVQIPRNLDCLVQQYLNVTNDVGDRMHDTPESIAMNDSFDVSSVAGGGTSTQSQGERTTNSTVPSASSSSTTSAHRQ